MKYKRNQRMQTGKLKIQQAKQRTFQLSITSAQISERLRAVQYDVRQTVYKLFEVNGSHCKRGCGVWPFSQSKSCQADGERSMILCLDKQMTKKVNHLWITYISSCTKSNFVRVDAPWRRYFSLEIIVLFKLISFMKRKREI